MSTDPVFSNPSCQFNFNTPAAVSADLSDTAHRTSTLIQAALPSLSTLPPEIAATFQAHLPPPHIDEDDDQANQQNADDTPRPTLSLDPDEYLVGGQCKMYIRTHLQPGHPDNSTREISSLIAKEVSAEDGENFEAFTQKAFIEIKQLLCLGNQPALGKVVAYYNIAYNMIAVYIDDQPTLYDLNEITDIEQLLKARGCCEDARRVAMAKGAKGKIAEIRETLIKHSVISKEMGGHCPVFSEFSFGDRNGPIPLPSITPLVQKALNADQSDESDDNKEKAKVFLEDQRRGRLLYTLLFQQCIGALQETQSKLNIHLGQSSNELDPNQMLINEREKNQFLKEKAALKNLMLELKSIDFCVMDYLIKWCHLGDTPNGITKELSKRMKRQAESRSLLESPTPLTAEEHQCAAEITAQLLDITRKQPPSTLTTAFPPTTEEESPAAAAEEEESARANSVEPVAAAASPSSSTLVGAEEVITTAAPLSIEEGEGDLTEEVSSTATDGATSPTATRPKVDIDRKQFLCFLQNNNIHTPPKSNAMLTFILRVILCTTLEGRMKLLENHYPDDEVTRVVAGVAMEKYNAMSNEIKVENCKTGRKTISREDKKIGKAKDGKMTAQLKAWFFKRNKAIPSLSDEDIRKTFGLQQQVPLSAAPSA